MTDQVIELARARLKTLNERVQGLRGSHGTEEDAAGITLLLEVFGMLVSQGERLIARKAFEISKEPGLRDEHLRSIRACVEALDKASGYDLEALVRRPRRDFEPLVKPFIRLAKAITDRHDTEVIFAAGERYEYDVWRDAFAHPRENLEVINDELAEDEGEGDDGTVLDRLPTIALVTYPARSDEDTFQHAVVAHELAHLALAKPLTSGGRSLRDDVFYKTLESSGDEDDEKTKRLKRWLDESASDLIAVRTIGPAFFFALTDYVLPTERTTQLSWSDRFGTHPSMIWRLERLLPEVRKFLGKPTNRSLNLRTAADVYADYRDRIKLHAQLGPVYTYEEEEREQALLQTALGEIKRRLGQVLGDEALYPLDVFAADLDLIWEKLAQGIAPAERVLTRTSSSGTEMRRSARPIESKGWSRPIDWRSILNAVYLYSLSGESRAGPLRQDDPAQQPRADARMARGSIELSEVLRRMIELKGSLDVLNEPKAWEGDALG